MGEPSHTQVVLIDESEVQAALELAAAHGVRAELVPLRGLEPLATATVVLVGVVSAVATVGRVLDQRKGGQVIDLRDGAPKAFYRSRDVVHGLVLIIARDGKVTVTVKEPEATFGKVLSTLPGLLAGTGSAKQAAETITEHFGQHVNVDTTQPLESEE